MSARDRILRIDDYLHGVSADAEAASLEEELFEAAAAGDDDDVRFFDTLSRTAVFSLQHGSLGTAGTRALLDTLRASGARIHFADLGAGGQIPLAEWEDDATDVVVFRLSVDVRGFEEVDVEMENLDGTPVKTFRDVRCDPSDGALYAVCEPPLARMAFGQKPRRARILAKRASSSTRETVAIYETLPPRRSPLP